MPRGSCCDENVGVSVVPVLRLVDAVTIPVSDLDAGLRFYQDGLGHQLLWRNDAIGQAGLLLPDSETEIVLSTEVGYAPTWLVVSLDEALDQVGAAGGRVVDGPTSIPVGRLAVVADPFGNRLVLLDLSKGRYITDADRAAIGVTKPPSA